MVVIGAGFIGLEFASVAAKLGRCVTVVEAVDRPMARVVSPPISAHFTAAHARAGTSLRFRAGVTRILGDGGRVVGVELADGEAASRPSSSFVGIGVLANAELAAAAGLPVANGVEVDAWLSTSDPAISAVGDCALHPSRWCDGPVRIESVQNAIDQAKCVAARLVGKPAPYTAVPWFLERPGARQAADRGACHRRRPGGGAGRPGERPLLGLRLPGRAAAGGGKRQPAGRPHDRPPPARRRPVAEPRRGGPTRASTSRRWPARPLAAPPLLDALSDPPDASPPRARVTRP